MLVAAWYTADRTSGCRTAHAAAVDDEQPGPFRGVEGARVDAEDGGGPAQRGDLTGVVGRGDQQQRLHRPAAAGGTGPGRRVPSRR